MRRCDAAAAATTTTAVPVLRPLLRLLVVLLIVPSWLVSWHLWDQHWWKFRNNSNNNNKGPLRISVVSARRRSQSADVDADLPNNDVAPVVPVGIFVPSVAVMPQQQAVQGNIQMVRVMSPLPPPPTGVVGVDLVEIAQRNVVLSQQQQQQQTEPDSVVWLQPTKSKKTGTTTDSSSGHPAWCLLHFWKTNENGHKREDKWCQQASSYHKVAFSNNNLIDTTGDYYYEYDKESTSSKTNPNVILRIQELFPSRSWLPFRASWNKSRQQKTFSTISTQPTPPLSPLQQALWVYPATFFWMALNVALAFVYWNARIPVSSVAQIVVYPLQRQQQATSQQQQDPQIWRLLTGATAHFELWHLGFNMMSLLALGQQLENGNGKYTSMEFWLYNFALLVWTGVVWLGLQYGIQRFMKYRNTLRRGENHHHHHVVMTPRPTVGFSGVLFAWMVVAALENRVSCPIPFMPTVCFHAFHIGSSFQFNWGPVVTLVLMQLVLPRASWTGHLAGILVGFAVHWGVLPPLLLHPAVALPGLYYLYLRFVRRILAGSNSSSRWAAFEGAENDDDSDDDQGSHKLYSLLFRPTLLLLLHGVTLLLSAFAFGLWSSLTVSYVWVLLFVHLFIKLKGQGDVPCGRDHASMVITRGMLLTAVMIQVADAMTLGAWVSWIRIQVWEQGHVGHPMNLEFSVLLIRTLMLFSTIFVCVRTLTPVREETGIFYYVFHYTVLSPCENVFTAVESSRRGNNHCQRLHAPVHRDGDGDAWAALGPGRRVGGGREISVTPNGPDDGNDRELSQLL